MCLPQDGCGCTIKARLQLCERDRDPIAKSNKRSRISLQMFSLDMTAPSITTPHVRGRGMSMTQSKSYSHGRIYIGLFHRSTSLSPLQRLFVLADASLSVSLSRSLALTFTFFLFFCLDNRNVQSFFNGARNYISSGLVQYCCPLPLPDNEDVCLKRYMALVLTSNYSLSLSVSVSLTSSLKQFSPVKPPVTSNAVSYIASAEAV